MSKQLYSLQRYAIYLGLARKQSKKSIAMEIGVHPSTVTREIQRNRNKYGQYVHTIAQQKCDSRKHSTLGNHRKSALLWWRVEQMIKDEDWSPRQISGVLAKEGVHICAQTIYNHVHADETGELAKHMPHELRYRRRQKKLRPTKTTSIPNRTSIHERPVEADGKRFGDWEMDLIVDGYKHVILTLVERSTNMLMMEKLPYGKKAVPVAKTVVRLLMPYRETVKTITTDN
jgi:IS30 family transposase